MSEPSAVLPLGFSALGKPLCDIALAPDTTRRDLAKRSREADLAGELIGALSAQTEGLCDFGDAHELHADQFTHPLDTVKLDWHSALDTVKGGKP